MGIPRGRGGGGRGRGRGGRGGSNYYDYGPPEKVVGRERFELILLISKLA